MTRKVRELMHFVRRPVVVDSTGLYREIGIRSFGRGVFHKPPVRGAQLGSKKIFEVHPGDLLLNIVFAWEGAVALAGPAEAGTCGSHRFLTYEINRALADPIFLRFFLISQRGLELLGAVSPGSAGRNRTLNREALEEQDITLPDVNEQRRIAADLTSISGLVGRLERPIAHVSRLLPVSLPSLLGSVFDRYATQRREVADLVEFVSDVVHPHEDPRPAQSFVGLQHVESHTGRRIGASPLGGEAGRKFRFAPGDVLYGYLRPYLNKVWLADRHGLCSVEQYVLRPKELGTGALVAYSLRSKPVWQRAIELTHSLQLPRLRSGLLATIQAAWPDTAMRQACLLDLAAMDDRVLRLIELASKRASLTSAFVPSLLNRAFG